MPSLRSSVEWVSARARQQTVDLDHFHPRLDLPDIHHADAPPKQPESLLQQAHGGNHQGFGVGTTTKHLSDPMLFVFSFRHPEKLQQSESLRAARTARNEFD